jgi:hypothetical protein
MKIANKLMTSLFLLPVVACTEGRVYVSQEQARTICTDRAIHYSDTLRGPFGETPGALRTQDFYRSCFHAKAGVNPSQKFVSTGTTRFQLNRVLQK